MNGIWLPIPDFPGYEISNLGDLTFLGHGNRERVVGWIEQGYKRTYIWRDGKRLKKFIHVLVLSAFCGKCPDEMEGCHDNGNGLDNRIENLRWDSHLNNMRD